MFILLTLAGIFCLSSGFVFIYKPGWIVNTNQFMREMVFNDKTVLFNRRKKGFLFMLLFILFSYWAYSRLDTERHRPFRTMVSMDRLLYESYQHLQDKEYRESKALCERAIERDRMNADAHYQLGAAHLLLNDPLAAKKEWALARSIDPDSYEAGRMRKLSVKHLNLPSENIAAFK